MNFDCCDMESRLCGCCAVVREIEFLRVRKALGCCACELVRMCGLISEWRECDAAVLGCLEDFGVDWNGELKFMVGL